MIFKLFNCPIVFGIGPLILLFDKLIIFKLFNLVNWSIISDIRPLI